MCICSIRFSFVQYFLNLIFKRCVNKITALVNVQFLLLCKRYYRQNCIAFISEQNKIKHASTNPKADGQGTGKMHSTLLDELNQNGYIVIESFLNPDEVNELYSAGRELCMDAPQENRKIFSTVNQKDAHSKETYFLDSGDKVRFFFEEGAVGENGELLVDPMIALNKVGHSLHIHHSIFNKMTFSNRVKEVCWQLNFNKPAVCQSMYIYKNPGIGGEVISHQDSWFLHTEPNSVIGFWFALEDCTLQNGCLQAIKGSHKSGVHRRYMRNPDKEANQLLIYDRPAPIYSQSSFTPLIVNKGTCIIIHGNVVHKSEQNQSQKSRHAYTFHVIETENVRYSEDNWLQPSENTPFPVLFERKNESGAL